MKKILFTAFLLLNVAVYAQDVSNVNTLRQRGKVQAKNKGEIAMYFADELKS